MARWQEGPSRSVEGGQEARGQVGEELQAMFHSVYRPGTVLPPTLATKEGGPLREQEIRRCRCEVRTGMQKPEVGNGCLWALSIALHLI